MEMVWKESRFSLVLKYENISSKNWWWLGLGIFSGERWFGKIIKITPVEYADQVVKIALTKELKPTEWVEVDITKKDDKSQASIQ